MFSTVTFSQSDWDLEKNNNLQKYRTVKIYDGKSKRKGWSKKITLENGIIKKIETYSNNQLTHKVEYHYNEKENLDYEVETFSVSSGGNINDTLKHAYLYNDKNQLISYKSTLEEKYSNFNNLNLPQTIERNSSLDSIFGYKSELLYDTIGNVIEEKTYSKNFDTLKIEINKYKYDKFNNVIELTRSSIPREKYPIHYGGGRSHYENEKFRYVYNHYNLWIEKYWIVENKEYLVAVRKFK